MKKTKLSLYVKNSKAHYTQEVVRIKFLVSSLVKIEDKNKNYKE